jgi:hypothetical protein
MKLLAMAVNKSLDTFGIEAWIKSIIQGRVCMRGPEYMRTGLLCILVSYDSCSKNTEKPYT